LRTLSPADPGHLNMNKPAANQPPTPPTPPAQPAPNPTPQPTPSTETVPEKGSDLGGRVPDNAKDLNLAETFLPENAPDDEGEEGQPGQPSGAAAPNGQPATPAAPTPPTGEQPATPPAPQPNTTQNAEIVDKTQTTPPVDPNKLYAGKYKTVEELRAGIQELGGKPTSENPEVLEQVYLTTQQAYTAWNQRQKKAEEIATPPAPADEGFKLTDDLIESMVNQLDFEHIDNAKDMAKQQFQIMFKTLAEKLPNMLPKQQAPQVDVHQVAAEVDRVKTGTDALAFIEGKVPRLTTDSNFRDNFARYLQDGKAGGKYPAAVNRDIMLQAMKDFLGGAASIAEEAKRLQDENDAAKAAAAAAPDNNPAPASVQVTPDPDEDMLGGILGAKVERDKKLQMQ
jgi:hypothetical protein